MVLNKSGSWTSTDRPGHPRSRPPIGQTSSGSAPPVNRGRPSRPPPHRPALSPTVPHTRPDPHIPRTSHDSNRRPATDSPALVRRPSDSLRPAHRSLLITPRELVLLGLGISRARVARGFIGLEHAVDLHRHGVVVEGCSSRCRDRRARGDVSGGAGTSKKKRARTCKM